MALGCFGVGGEAGAMGIVERCWRAGALGPGHEGAEFGGLPFETPDFERVCRAKSGELRNRV